MTNDEELLPVAAVEHSEQIKLIGLYALDDIPRLKENHRAFAERSGMEYLSYPIRNYYDKWTLVWHLLQEHAGRTLAFIDAHSYFVVPAFSGSINEDVIIQEVNGKLMDNFFIVRSSPETRRLFLDVQLHAASSFLGKGSLLFAAPLPPGMAKAYAYQIAPDLYFNIELAFPSNALELSNILVCRYKGDDWSSQLWTAAEVLCHHRPPKENPSSAAGFEIFNPGKAKALLTLSSPESGEPLPEYATVSERNFRAYAERHDLTLYIYRAIPDFCRGLHSAWTKPYLVRKHLGEHDYVSWIDADVLISRDFALPENEDVSVYSDPGAWLFNAGFMTFRNTAKTLDYLQAVIARCETIEDRSSLYANGGDQKQFIEEFRRFFPDVLPHSNLRGNTPLIFGSLREQGPGLWHFMGLNPSAVRTIVMDYYDKYVINAA